MSLAPLLTGFPNILSALLGWNDPPAPKKAAPTRTTKATRAVPKKVPVLTKKQAIAATAKAQADRKANASGNFGTAYLAGMRRGFFGVPERLAAAGERWLPTAITGNNTDASYDDILQLIRANTDAEMAKSTTGNILGLITAGVAGGRGAGGVLKSGAGGLAAAGVPGAKTAATALEALTTLKKGGAATKLANAAKIAATGGAAGGTQAVGEGSDPVRGTIYGALTAPALVGGGKALEWASRPARDFLRMTSARGLLQRFTTTTAEELKGLADAWRQKTGAEPTVFELLPLQDREAIGSAVKLMPGTSREKLAGKVRERAGNIGTELADRTGAVTDNQAQFLARNMAQDLAKARGVANPTAEELALAKRAVRDPTELENLRSTEASSIMAPHDNKIAYDSVDDLLPQSPVNNGGQITFKIDDPEAASAIRGAAGTLRLSPDGVKIRDVTDIISTLKADTGRGGIEGRAAQRAINHLEDIVRQDHPEASDAMQRMTDAYAGRSRMLEGMREGRASRLREDVPVTGRKQALKVRNAYDTAEGAAGRVAGQRAELMSDFAASPASAVRAAGDVAENPGLRAAIDQNLGTQAGENIADAAGAQSESARRLASLLPEQGGEGGSLDLADMTRAMTALSPSALPSTKFWAVAQLQRAMKGIPEGRANQLVDALFSQDPKQMENAFRLLNNAGDTGKRFLRQMTTALAGGVIGNEAGQAMGQPSDAAPDPAAGSAPDMPAPDALATDDPYAEFPLVANPDTSTWDKRGDGSDKGMGWLGLRQRPDGSVSSEISIGVEMDGKETEIPLMVPGLEPAEVKWLLTNPIKEGMQVPGAIRAKAEAFARQRIADGKSPFRQPGEASPIDAVNKAESAGSSDYAGMSDAELLAHIGQGGDGAPAADYSSMSNDELLGFIGQEKAVPYGHSIIKKVFPGATVTEDDRDPNSKLGKANPGSFHNKTDRAVDVRPIRGMSFNQFIEQLKASGYEIEEAIDEVKKPSKHATGPHWHVVFK